jgi:YVTN family beta-propeller protein/autotransporter-associated beta strand protein
MLAVTASVTGSELLINLNATHDVAEIQVEGGEYKVRSGTVSAGGFPLAAVDSIRIHGDASLDGQAVYVKPGGTIADPLTIDAGIESTVIHAPIVTSGAVTIDSAAITLSENVSTSGNQTYAGTVRIANDIVLDAGAGEIRFGSEIRSTAGSRAELFENLGNPFRLAVSADGQTLYASDAISNYVYFVDLAAQQLDTVDLGKSVANVALSPDGRRLYVANSLDGSVSVLDTTTRGILATIGVAGTPEGMAFSPDGQILYVANYSDDSVAVISTATNRMTRAIPVEGSPTAVAVGPDGRLWVASEVANRVTLIDVTAGDASTSIAVGRGPGGVVVAPDGSRVYVTNNFENSVSVIETATEAVIATIGVGSGPTEVVATPDGRLVYVVNGFSDSVSVIDAEDLLVATTAPVGNFPVGIALTADGTTAYVANLSSFTELGNDARGLTLRTAGTVRFEATAATVDPLGELTVEAGQQVGPPSNLVPVESIGEVTLAVDVDGNLRANGTLILFGGNPVNYQGMIDQGWTIVAADVVEGINTLALRQNGTGVLHFWRLTSSWVQEDSYGWQYPGSTEFSSSEVAFGMDFDGDGLLGSPPVAVESAGSITLGRNAAGEYLAGSDGSWTPITYAGFPLSDATFPNFLVPVAAERVGNTNQVLFLNPGGAILDFTFDDSWAYTATNDWSDPGTADFYGRETEFGIDVDGDGTIGQPAPGINVPPGAIATDGTQRTGDEQVIKRGGGTLVLDLANTHSGGTLVEEGTVIVRNATALGTGTLEVQPGATVKLEVGFGTVALPQLDLAAGAVLDLGEAQLTIGPGGADEATIRQWIIAGRGDGAFNGTSGLRSSAAATAAGSRTIGYTVGADGSATVMFTAIGDLNLDRKVDVFDLLAMDAGGRFGSTLPAGWSQGDLDYDGRTNIFDLLGIDTAGSFNAGSIVPAASGLEANVSSLTETTVSPAVATATADSAAAMSGAATFARLAAGIECEKADAHTRGERTLIGWCRGRRG